MNPKWLYALQLNGMISVFTPIERVQRESENAVNDPEPSIVNASQNQYPTEELRPLAPQIIRVWWLVELIEAAISGGIAIALAFFIDHPAAWMSMAALTILLSLFAEIYPKLLYDSWRYGVLAHEIVIQKGLIWKSRTCIPRQRIQHIDISSGPIDRKFGLCSFKIHTAGSKAGEIVGITPSQAEELRQVLLPMGTENAEPSGI